MFDGRRVGPSRFAAFSFRSPGYSTLTVPVRVGQSAFSRNVKGATKALRPLEVSGCEGSKLAGDKRTYRGSAVIAVSAMAHTLHPTQLERMPVHDLLQNEGLLQNEHRTVQDQKSARVAFHVSSKRDLRKPTCEAAETKCTGPSQARIELRREQRASAAGRSSLCPNIEDASEIKTPCSVAVASVV